MSRRTRTDGGRSHDHSRTSASLTYELDRGERPSEGIVRAVATLTNTPVLDLDPLFETIDPDHLDGVLASATDRSRASLSFRFNSCSVSVTPTSVAVHVLDGEP